jgi:uncharacterized membrane protein YhfC
MVGAEERFEDSQEKVVDPSPMIPLSHLAAGLATLVFLLVLPFGAMVAGHHWLKVRWRYAFYGAAVFLVFQVLTRVPLLQIFGPKVQALVQHSPLLHWGWLFVLALTAGLFEEVGRYFGFRVFFRSDEKTWAKAVMFGIGHGGLESLFVGATGIVSTIQLWTLSHGGLESLPADQRTQIAGQLASFATQPVWLQLAGSWERVWAMLIQIAMAVIVLQVFNRHSLLWLWLAIGAHAAVDLVSLATVQVLSRQPTIAIVATEALVALFGVASLWVIARLRENHEPVEPDIISASRRPTLRRQLRVGGHA